ncbi:uroporphyrinogen-III synthase [Roseateles sp. BYS180W]|uniref:Uroporphyrinogen-III synthase n=1 Tax=Roseateles rivi TaxID=3299028 RepID=A0ABW7FVK1_9BURK
MSTAAQLILTRPRAQAVLWQQRLAVHGVPTRVLPLLDILPPASGLDLAQAWSVLPQTQVLVFVSPNAVHHFFAAAPKGAAWPAQVLAATVGPGSAQALTQHGVPAACIVQPAPDAPSLDSEQLWPVLEQRLAAVLQAGQPWSAWVIRGEGGREWLAQRLQERGAAVHYCSAYRRVCPQWTEQDCDWVRQAWQQPQQHIWLFSSSEAAAHARLLGAAAGGGAAPWRQTLALCTHERIARSVEALGVGHVVLVRPDAAAVAQGFRQLTGGALESPAS